MMMRCESDTLLAVSQRRLKEHLLSQLCVLTFPQCPQWSHDLSTKQPPKTTMAPFSSSSSTFRSLSNSSKVFKCRPPSSTSSYFSSFSFTTSSSVSSSHQFCHRVLHLVAFLFFLVTLLLTTTASTVSANSNSQSFPTFSYCR